MKHIIIFILLLTQNLFGQITPDSIRNMAKNMNLRPLKEVDTVSTKVPDNVTTKSGWHIDYYAYKPYNTKLDLHIFFYNDKAWYYGGKFLHTTAGEITYSPIKVLKETDTFLYLMDGDSSDMDINIFILPKKQKDVFVEFTNLIYADYTNNIFIEYNPIKCQATEKIYLKVWSLNNDKTKEIEFSKGICKGLGNSTDGSGKLNWCIDSITFSNGVLTLTASLTEKKSNKIIKETKKVDL